MTTPACMGGWCAVRENCKHYHAPWTNRQQPIERLCETESPSTHKPDPHNAFAPMRFVPIEVAA